jgi:phospholipase/carboxylesterase
MTRVGSFVEAGSGGRPMSRRTFLGASARGLLPLALASCVTEPTGISTPRDPARLTVQPKLPTTTPELGATRLTRGSFSRGAILYVPEGYDHDVPAPLLVTFHGYPGDAELWVPFYPKCDLRGIVMLAVESREDTWDVLATGSFGPDVDFIDWALDQTFGQCNIDLSTMALCGFSDGASYSLSLGVSNGDLFSRLIAFSPGIIQPGFQLVGKPDVWISHGYDDEIFNEAYTEQEIVGRLRRADYSVEYTPFEGGHEVPAEISDAALDWFAGVDAAVSPPRTSAPS